MLLIPLRQLRQRPFSGFFHSGIYVLLPPLQYYIRVTSNVLAMTHHYDSSILYTCAVKHPPFTGMAGAIRRIETLLNSPVLISSVLVVLQAAALEAVNLERKEIDVSVLAPLRQTHFEKLASVKERQEAAVTKYCDVYYGAVGNVVHTRIDHIYKKEQARALAAASQESTDAANAPAPKKKKKKKKTKKPTLAELDAAKAAAAAAAADAPANAGGNSGDGNVERTEKEQLEWAMKESNKLAEKGHIAMNHFGGGGGGGSSGGGFNSGLSGDDDYYDSFESSGGEYLSDSDSGGGGGDGGYAGDVAQDEGVAPAPTTSDSAAAVAAGPSKTSASASALGAAEVDDEWTSVPTAASKKAEKDAAAAAAAAADAEARVQAELKAKAVAHAKSKAQAEASIKAKLAVRAAAKAEAAARATAEAEAEAEAEADANRDRAAATAKQSAKAEASSKGVGGTHDGKKGDNRNVRLLEAQLQEVRQDTIALAFCLIARPPGADVPRPSVTGLMGRWLSSTGC